MKNRLLLRINMIFSVTIAVLVTLSNSLAKEYGESPANSGFVHNCQLPVALIQRHFLEGPGSERKKTDCNSQSRLLLNRKEFGQLDRNGFGAIGTKSLDSATGREVGLKFRIYLVGDSNEIRMGNNSILEDIRTKLASDKTIQSHIVFLGDNIPPKGMPQPLDRKRQAAELVLKNQLDILPYLKGNIWIVPGNTDWNNGKSQGWNAVLRAERYVSENYPSDRVFWIPGGGCPGPNAIELDQKTILVFFDSQWWLQQNEKPRNESDCQYKSEKEVLEAFRYLLEENRDKTVLVAMHHPLRSYGRHNGAFSWKDHIFPFTAIKPNLYIPLPIIGSVYPFYRSWFGNLQDLPHPIYEAMANALDGLFDIHPNVIQVAGHEQGLAYTKEGNTHYVISGSGSSYPSVKKNNNADFVYPTSGYSTLDFFENLEVRLSFFSPLQASPLYTAQLGIPYAESQTKLVNFNREFPEYATLPISTDYLHRRSFYRFFGKNYRETWAVPTRFKTFDITKIKPGIFIVGKGGGLQTHSLHLADKEGNEYVLRSVNKFAENALSPSLRQTILKNIIQDQISASHPYAALAVARLAEHVGISHTNPVLYYLPDDPLLGVYRKDYGNQLYLFEEREVRKVDTSKKMDLLGTEKMLRKIREDNYNLVNQKEVLKARTFDLWIGDWDRHDDQWRWKVEKGEKHWEFSPMPRDRDQAFFLNQGLVPKLVSRKWADPRFQGFDYKPPRFVSGFMFNARYFDRSFLHGLTRADWEKTLDEVIQKMTEESVADAFLAWPEEIALKDGPDIQAKLLQRRTWLKHEMLKHYEFLSKKVDIPGSDRDETFQLTHQEDGSLGVEVRKIQKSGQLGHLLYTRTFLPDETEEVVLYGLDGKDEFRFKGEGPGKIKIRVIPGTGNKVIDDQGITKNKNTLIYQHQGQKESLKLGNSTRIKRAPTLNYLVYDRKEFKYDRLMPLISGAINKDDGFYLGAGVLWEKHGFKKEPFSLRQHVIGNFAFNSLAFDIHYSGHAVDIVGNLDLVWKAEVRAPDYAFNYFGLGNESEFSPEIHEIEYYRARINWYELHGGLQSKLWENGSLTVGPHYQVYRFDPNENSDNFITSPDSDLDQEIIDKAKFFTGLSAKFVYDRKDVEKLPSRGIHFEALAKRMWGLNSFSGDFIRIDGELALFWTFRYPSRTVWATRFGGGKNWGNFEYFQGQTLGGLDNLRGYRRYRFNGNAVAYNNTELRVHLFNFKTIVLPATAGILIFNDLGRVWHKDEKSNKLHNSFGLGIWLAPLNKIVATLSIGFNEEEYLPFFTFGYSF